jgi:hypothetical protein
MGGSIRLLALGVAVAVTPFAITTFASPSVSHATECGLGTVLDPGTDTCVVAQSAPPPPPEAPVEQPPPPPPPPAWNGPRPYVSASICAPIPFVSLCVGI